MIITLVDFDNTLGLMIMVLSKFILGTERKQLMYLFINFVN